MLRFIRYTDFNPRSPCGERQGKPKCCNYIKEFQSTLPVWGATIHRVNNKALAEKFQSTLPVWGATPTTCKECAHYDAFQSTLPVWGATHVIRRDRRIMEISIHAPRVGSDHNHGTHSSAEKHFNPRSPCGERQRPNNGHPAAFPISIHAPRVGSDLMRSSRGRIARGYFNPRSPCGERPSHW